MKHLLNKLITDMSSNEYHSTPNTYSSSQLKTMLEDSELFYKKYISKTIEKEEMAAFDIGTYFHTAVLEPQLLKEECKVWNGIRRGKEWEKFKEANKNKAIITKSEVSSAERLIEAVNNSSLTSGLLKRGKPEVSTFVKIKLWEGLIYAPDYDLRLTKLGWDYAKRIPKGGVDLVIKVRADLLGDDFILDLKSTSGNVKAEYAIKNKISDYSYDLSASLYLDIFSLVLKKPMRKFIWTFVSKDLGGLKNWEASERNVLIGRAKYMKALRGIEDGIRNKWEFTESVSTLEPNHFELSYLSDESDLDFL